VIRPAPAAVPAEGSRPVPAQAGIGLRAVHHDEFLERRPDVAWVEVHSENFFAAGGRQLEVIDAVRRDYAVSLHGVGLSLGSADALDAEHLRRLQRLVERVQPALVSEHACWCGVGGIHLNDLLPLPGTTESLAHLVSRVGEVQDRLGRQILVENVSSYLRFAGDEMPEWEFLAALARHSGCGILLDVNNIYVSAVNHGFDARAYLAAIPVDAVGEIHVAGHSVVQDGTDTLLVDTHDGPVIEPVWALYRAAVRRFGPRPTLLEWDAELPALDVLIAEARKADHHAGRPDALVA
jgi:hypothetical protein